MLYKELTEKKNELVTRADELLGLAKTEKRELTEDEAAELAEIRDTVRRIAKTLELEDDMREISAETAKPAVEEPKTEERSIEEREIAAFDAFVRGTVLNSRDDTAVMTKGDNGAVIPKTIANKIIKKVYDICPILEKSSKYNVKGQLDIPYYAETAGTAAITVDYQSEFVSIASNVGAFESITLTGFLAGALTKISRSLINNAQFNVTDFIVEHMAYAIKRFIEGELLNGTASKVRGLADLSNSLTAAAQNAITADEVIKLHDKVKDEFQANAIWIMSPATRTALRLLKDNEGRYLLQDDINSAYGTKLLGKDVYVSDNMPEIAHSKTAIYYGDMSGLATKFNEEINIEVLRERYADQHVIGVVGWFEFDSKVENAQKIAKLVMA